MSLEKFPHTPHLAWLGSGTPRDDKVLSPTEARELLAGEVVVEEKLDGANLGLSFDAHGNLIAQNRGSVLLPPYAGQFKALGPWLRRHQDALVDALGARLRLFGEWCAFTHSMAYTALPDWFIAFDLYDIEQRRFWSADRRNALLAELGIPAAPEVGRGRFGMDALTRLLETTASAFGPPRVEGFVLRRESGDWLEARAKIVRAEFTQAIGTHWRRRAPVHNRLAHGAGLPS